MKPSWLWKKDDVKNIQKILYDSLHPVFHICSGTSEIGEVRLDSQKSQSSINDRAWRMGCCTVQGDMLHLPFKSGIAGTVLIDPPYDYDFIQEALINECVRILKPTGKLVFIAPWIPCSNVLKVIKTDYWKVGKDRPYYKILSISQKFNAQISDYE